MNSYSDSGSSHVHNEGNEVGIVIDELLQERIVINAMLFHIFQDNAIGDDTRIIESLFQILKL